MVLSLSLILFPFFFSLPFPSFPLIVSLMSNSTPLPADTCHPYSNQIFEGYLSYSINIPGPFFFTYVSVKIQHYILCVSKTYVYKFHFVTTIAYFASLITVVLHFVNLYLFSYTNSVHLSCKPSCWWIYYAFTSCFSSDSCFVSNCLLPSIVFVLHFVQGF